MTKRGQAIPFTRIDTPRNCKRVIPIVRVKANDVLIFAICSPRVWGYATHWVNNRTLRCTAATGKCPYCNPDFSTRDKGFLLVANTVGQVRGFLELTPLAWTQVQELSVDLKGLRGKVVQVKREHGTMKGRLLVEYIGEYQGELALPQDRDPEPTLRRIHGLPDLP
jgi:hypothetical protein